jgi:hypothetical protein
MRLLYKSAIVLTVFLPFWSCGIDKIVEPVDDSILHAIPSDLTVFEVFFSSTKVDEEVKVDAAGLQLDKFKTYL